jgi:hypothetical protein
MTAKRSLNHSHHKTVELRQGIGYANSKKGSRKAQNLLLDYYLTSFSQPAFAQRCRQANNS